MRIIDNIAPRKLNPPIIVAGFMSGTSLDGVDVSVIETDGEQIFQIYEEFTLPYPKDFQDNIKKCLGSESLTPEIIKLTQSLMNFHADAFNGLKHKSSVDLVSIHGQTIFHMPRDKDLPAHTWQIADPEYLQSLIKKPIVFDLRSEDITQGGEGAPLVPIYHHALARGLEKPVAFVNIGGVANITWIPNNNPQDMLAGDTGPGVALLNDLISKYTSRPFDKDGDLARQGLPHKDFVKDVLQDPYFQRSLPKSLDRNSFAWISAELESVIDCTKNLSNALSTLCNITVQGILSALPDTPQKIILCGGGRHHAVLSELLQKEHPGIVVDINDLGINGDFVEAQAWAFLGARHLYSLPYSFPKTTGVRYPTCGGRLLRLD